MIGCLVLFAFVMILTQQNKKCISFLSHYQTSEEVAGFYRIFYQDIFQTLSIQDVLLNEECLVTDEHRNKKALKAIIDKPKLVLRYSELNCNVCVDTLLSCLNQRFAKLGMEHLLILATYHDERNYRIFKRINQIKEMYLIDSIVGSRLEEENIPYLFFVDNDYRIKYPFIPHKEVMQETHKYLDFIETRLKRE